jgi:hypothetical protein
MRANVPIARGGRPLDAGAAAVEFALLLPLFVMLVFGIISGGFTFDRWIGVTQSAREASRFAATYPVDPSNMNQWYLDVANTAAEGAGKPAGSLRPPWARYNCDRRAGLQPRAAGLSATACPCSSSSVNVKSGSTACSRYAA